MHMLHWSQMSPKALDSNNESISGLTNRHGLAKTKHRSGLAKTKHRGGLAKTNHRLRTIASLLPATPPTLGQLFLISCCLCFGTVILASVSVFTALLRCCPLTGKAPISVRSMSLRSLRASPVVIAMALLALLIIHLW